MTAVKKIVLIGLFIFLSFAILNPNPFGNNPDIIGDESYFLSTSLFSIEKHTIPGWEFTPSGAYYGGPQTYIDTLVMLPVLGAVVAASDFSIMAAKLWVAQNTGELLHILRLVNGISALATILFFFFYFKKREIPRELALTLILFLFLLLSNVLVIEFLHTAKMWVFYIIFVSAMSAIFIAQEYYLARLGRPFIDKKYYIVLFVWSGVLTFFQSWFGVFSIALLALYAILLRHVSFRDLWSYCLKYWYLIVLFSATQISFVWRAYTISAQLKETTSRTAEGAIDWFARLTKPLIFTVTTQPLSLLYIAAAIVLLFLIYYCKSILADSRKRLWIAIACLHPVLTYLIFHAGIGLDAGARYAIILTIACSFSAAILLSELSPKAVRGALVLSGVLFFAIGVHAIQLFWRPSSETVLLATIMEKYNSPANVFIADHTAKRLTLPVNYESLPLLGETRSDMGRFKFLLENRDILPKDPVFKPLAFITYSDEEDAAYIERFAGTHSIWMIKRNCANPCTADEIRAGTCFQIHMEACFVAPQDTNALPDFFSSKQLGNSYIVRKIR
ncbi:MAG: hypothetical protein Q7S01_05360 [bacterium]|nr:hypothetical protein [bacterium]